tara:strand:- start:908 stop:2134 length:1227 start_codon:yes stop_codon:yes gene_type:complete
MFYNLSLLFFSWGIHLAAFFGHSKAKKIVVGNRGWQSNLRNINPEKRKVIWFHAASLGEFEQGRPLLEKFKKEQEQYFILLSFFSPSGYEIHKNYAKADHICYLPLDTKQNAKKFLSIVQPEMAIFIKYEFWFNYLKQLQKRNSKSYLVSGIFNKNFIFFQWYGGWFRNKLDLFEHFFLQDEYSKLLLEKVGLKNCTVTGDTRFDRVIELRKTEFNKPLIERFCTNKKVMILGSAWEKEMEFARKFSEESEEWFFIIAPHEINSEKIDSYLQSLKVRGIKLSNSSDSQNLSEYKVLVIDQIGLLSKIYRFANVAFIGGGFGKGIHNLLEAAVYEVPVIFGPNYSFFKEAKDLIACGGGFSISNYAEFQQIVSTLSKEENIQKAASASKKYVLSEAGATNKIYAALTRS